MIRIAMRCWKGTKVVAGWSVDERCNDSFVLYTLLGEEEVKRGGEGGSRFVEIYEKPVVFIKSFVETPDRASRENSETVWNDIVKKRKLSIANERNERGGGAGFNQRFHPLWTTIDQDSL